MLNRRRLLIRILSLLLLFALIIPQGVYVGSFAAPRTDEVIDVVEDEVVYYDGPVTTEDDYNVVKNLKEYSYMLTVSTGNGACDYVDKIAVKYISNDGLLRTQTLDPTAYIPYFPYSFLYSPKCLGLTMSDFNYSDYIDEDGPSYFGNINLFYRSIITNAEADTFNLYADRYSNVFRRDNKLSYSVVTKSKKSNMNEFFRSNTTEYICFQTDYSVEKFISVEFILRDEAKEHVCDWSLLGWKIFKINNEKIAPKFIGYGYFSDRMGVGFEGQLVSQSLKMVDGEYPGFDKEDGISRIIFTDIDQKSIVKTYQTVNGKIVLSPTYYYNYNDTYAYLAYDMTSETGDSYNGMTIGQVYKSTVKKYIFKIDLSNQNGSGIENFLSVDGQKGIVLKDALYAKLKYTNDFGNVETVNVPIVTNSIMEYGKLNNNGTTLYDAVLKNDAVYAYAQEGNSLLFYMDFPNIVSLDSVQISLENSDDPTDEVIIDKIEVYEITSEVDTTMLLENKTDLGIIDMCLKGGSADPAYLDLKYVSDPDMSDVIIKKSGESAFFAMTKYTGENPKYGQDIEDTYIITINTSNVPDAGTTENVYFRYSYLDSAGMPHKSEECVMTDLCSDFYGYNRGIVVDSGQTIDEKYLKSIQDSLPWAQAKMCNIMYYQNRDITQGQAIAVDVNYISHMAKGSSMKLMVKIKDFKKFTGFSFRMENGTDLWQIDSISTEKLISLSDRILTRQSEVSKIYCIKNNADAYVSYGFNVDRKYTSEKGSYVLYDDIDILMQNNNETEFDIEDESITTDTSGRDCLDYYLKLDYSKAVSGLQFDTAAMTYEMRVTVAGNESIVSDDDAGSGNLYYFQLIFKNGMSGFVLANQQLQGDGFRAGQTETFTITTNENYGDITAIRIIPDEISDQGDKLDKLKIDQIEVVSNGPGQQKKCTTFYNIGWIGADYFETAGTKGRDGKTIQEAATTVLPASNANVTSLEFAILTGQYTSTADQFKGTLTATISYKNSNGELKTIKDIDVVKKIYEYMDRSSSSSLKDSTRTSDPTWMFRANHTDRFVVDITDIKELVSVKLHGTSTQTVDWPVSEISVHMVDGEGQLYLNSQNDFQRKYAEGNYELISNKVSNKTMPCKFKLVAASTNEQTFAFANGLLPEHESAETGFESLSRVPESSDDSVNIFLYMADGAKSPADGGYKLNLRLNYSSISTGKSYVRTLDSDNPGCTYIVDKGRNALCFMNVSASYLSQITSFTVNTDSETSYAKFTGIVVQHVRNNTIIDAFDLSVFGTDAASRYGITAYQGVTASTGNSQLLTVHLDELSEAFSIVAETRDIAAALIYTSSQDPSTQKIEYSSKNVFASDGGTYAVDGGSMITFNFSESYIDEIVGVRLTSLNGASCVVDSAVLECYEIDSNGVSSLSKYVSFNPKEDIIVNGSNILSPTDEYNPAGGLVQNETNKLRRVDLGFTTINPNNFSAESEISKIDSNGACPIKLIINYVADSGIGKTKMEKYTIADIRDLAGYNGSFAQGGTANVSLFLPGIKRISSIEIIPYSVSEGDTATWNLGSISYAISDGKYSSPRTVPVNCRITEKNNAGVFYLSDMTVNLTVSGAGIETTTFSDGTLKLSVNPKDSLTITASVDGTFSSYGYGYKVEQIVENARVVVYEKNSVSNRTSFAYTVPDYNVEKDANKYIITVYAEENPTLSSSVEITLIAPTVTKLE